MMYSVPATPENLTKLSEMTSEDAVLKGLSKGKLGFIISAPDVGKGYLCLSIAYELATNERFVNLRSGTTPLKTLYWPIEDGVPEVSKRMLKHFSAMPPHIVDKISKNISLLDNQEPIVTMRGGEDISSYSDSRKKLIKECEGFDLLIIDTLREASGNADETDDDMFVKNALQQIAQEAHIAILLVHHITKNAARGLEKISNVSGSGFSRVQANSRLHIYIEKRQGENNQPERTFISHLKANNVTKEERIVKQELFWTSDDLLSLPINFDLAKQPIASSVVKKEKPQGKKSTEKPKTEINTDILDITSENELSLEDIERILEKKTEIVETEPKVFDLSGSSLSELSIEKRRALEEKRKKASERDRSDLKAYLAKKGKDPKSR